MQDYIDVLLLHISEERLNTLSREYVSCLAQEEAAFTALNATFTEEQSSLFRVYDNARSACEFSFEDAYARQAFLLAREIFR